LRIYRRIGVSNAGCNNRMTAKSKLFLCLIKHHVVKYFLFN